LSNAGNRAVRFFNNLTHTGDYSGETFNLRPWQEEPIKQLFGTLRPDGTRQFRKTFWGLPRKQGKTELVAAGGLFLLLGQGRKEQRIYTASGDVEQAALIFRAACDMIRNDPQLEQLVVIYDGYKRIDYPAMNSSLKVLSSVPKSKHGLGPTAVLIDEYHVVDEELVNILTTGFGARKDPLTWMITTAGWDRESICFDEWQYALAVRDGAVSDPTYLPVIYAAEPSDDWTDEAIWHKAMPALGDFCSLEFIREEFKKARERPRFENTFRQLYLNQWTEQSERWLSTERWSELGGLDEATLKGRPCWAGYDAGVTGDMTALVRVFEAEDGSYEVTGKFWVPEQGRWRSEQRSYELYRRWAKEGKLTFTDGEATDFDLVEQQILEMNAETPFMHLFADRAYATHMLSRLWNNYQISVKGIAQGPITLNEPMMKLEGLILDRRIKHADCPILAWNVANAVVRRNPTGLMSLDKSKATNRIDGLAAMINALAAMMADQQPVSPYETERLLVL
jgi:phage terminase large subunit-like protein